MANDMKGFIGERFLIFLCFLIIPFIVLLAFTVAGNQIQADLASSNVISAVPLANAQSMLNLLQYMDYIIPFIVFGACIASFIYAAFLQSSKILFAVGFLFILVLVFIQFYISNTLYTIATNSAFLNAAAEYPNTLYIIAYLPYLELVLDCIYLLIAFTGKAKFQGLQESFGSPQW